MSLLKVSDNYSATIVGNFALAATTITVDVVPVKTVGYLTVFDLDGNQFEKIKYAGVSGLNLTGCVRGLSFSDNSDTPVSGLAKDLKNGMAIKMTVSQHYINSIIDILNGDAPAGGVMQNPATRTLDSNRDIVDKQYVDETAIAGAPKMTEAVYGIAVLSSAAVDPTAPVVLNNEEVSATPGANKVVKANAGGNIEGGFTLLLPGIITPYAGSTAPTGWLLADGSTKDKTTYAALFAIIGHTYGADPGSNGFILPDLKGRVPVGKSTDVEFDVLGETGGEKTHQLSTAELASHSHVVNGISGGGAVSGVIAGVGSGGAAGTFNTDAAGSGTAHNNLQPYIALNYIIKY